MKQFFTKANKRISVSGAAALLIATTMIGQLLGFLRVKLINANFPAFGDGSTDVFFAAFKLPDFFFLTLAAGALGVAFIPYLSDRFEKGDKQGAWDLSSSLLNLLSIIMGGVAVILFVFAEPLIANIVAPDLTAAQLDNAVTIMRLISLNPMLFTVASILMSMQQTMGRFFFYAVAPLFYNLSIIISIFVFRDNIGIAGLGIGALIGAALQLVIAIIGMVGMHFKYKTKIKWQNPSFRGVLKQLPPRSIDQGIDAINSIAETNFARRLGEGFITYYENAFVLHTAPILLIGTAISTAAFPRLTERLSQNRPDLFRRDFIRILRAMIWISLPVVVVSYFARAYLARLIYSNYQAEIALIFGFLAGAIMFRIIYNLLSRYFYAYKDTVTPLIVSLFTIGLNIFLAYNLSKATSYGAAGLAIAQAIAAVLETTVLTAIIFYRDRKIFDSKFLDALLRMLSATGFSVVAAYIMVSFFPLQIDDTGFIVLGSKFIAISGVTISVYVAISFMLRLEEPKPVIKRIANIILKPVRIQW